MARQRIDPGSLDQEAGDLFVAARTLVEGLLQGRHRSPQRGLATEFYDFRAYNPGEPAAAIDWKVFARTDRYFVRRRRHEAQLGVMLVVDASASMAFAELEGSVRRARRPAGRVAKMRRAAELAAAIAILSVRQGDRVGLVTVGAGHERPQVIGVGGGWPHIHGLVHALETIEPESEGALSEGLEAAARATRERGLIIAIGDALEPPGDLLDSFARLRFGAAGGRTFASSGPRTGRDIALLQVLSADELDLGALDAGRLIDPESGVAVEATGDEIADAYAARIGSHLDALRAGVEAMGGRYALSSTGEAPIRALRALLAGAGRASGAPRL